MRDDPKAEGSRWLEQAREDLKWAELLAREGGFHVACFIARPVAEKALKAFLYAAGESVVLGHSVERLCLAAGERDQAFRDHIGSWAGLDGYYLPTRYPNSLPGSILARVYSREAAQDAVGVARDVVGFVAARMSGGQAKG